MQNFLIYVFVIIIINGCHTGKIESVNDRQIDLKNEINILFHEYNYEFKKGMQRGFANYFNVFIKKDDLSLYDFNRLKAKIEKKWKLVYLSEDQYVFCYNRYNQMTILYPQKLEYFDKFGDRLHVKSASLDSWIIGIKYIEEGTAYCKDEVFK